jgi:hypothetical protein
MPPCIERGALRPRVSFSVDSARVTPERQSFAARAALILLYALCLGAAYFVAMSDEGNWFCAAFGFRSVE